MTKKAADKKQTGSTKKQNNDPKHLREAHDMAEHDIAEDADLSIHSPNDDLDEAELAQLGGDKNDLI